MKGKQTRPINVQISKELKDRFDDETPQSLNKYEIIEFLITKWLDDPRLREEFKKLKDDRRK